MTSEALPPQHFSSAVAAAGGMLSEQKKKKAFPGQTWSHAETVALIEAYEAKWTELRRGHLRAHQWEEVADSIAEHCGLTVPSKNGTQCRHKIEKLRKRYRTERDRSVVSAWPYFDLMDRMESCGTSIRGLSSTRRNLPPPSESEPDEDDIEDAEIHTRSINGILSCGWGGGGGSGLSRVPMDHYSGRRVGFEGLDGEDLEEEENDSDEEEDEHGSNALGALASVVRTFGQRYEKLAKRRMEMMRQVEMERLEMETKREELVLDSQRCLLESISAVLSSRTQVKKAKKPHDL